MTYRVRAFNGGGDDDLANLADRLITNDIRTDEQLEAYLSREIVTLDASSLLSLAYILKNIARAGDGRSERAQRIVKLVENHPDYERPPRGGKYRKYKSRKRKQNRRKSRR